MVVIIPEQGAVIRETIARVSMSKDIETDPDILEVEMKRTQDTSIQAANPSWSPFWIYCTITFSMLYSFIGGWLSLAISPFYLTLAEEYQQSISNIAWLTSTLVLALGFGNFITVPVAVCYGRRHAYVWSFVVTLASCIWAAMATSYGSLLGARIVMGLGTAGIETLTPMTASQLPACSSNPPTNHRVQIVDVLPRDKRGTWNTVYFNFIFGGANMGAIVSGLIAASSLEWRWSFWVICIITGVVTIGTFLLMPETIPQSFGNVDAKQNTRRPSKAAFSLIPKRYNPNMTFTKALCRPFYTLLSPITIYCSFMLGLFCCMFLITQVAQAQIFVVNYGFDVRQTSLTNFGFFIGQICGIFLSGFLADALLARALRKHGRWEPEMRLLALIPSSALVVLGLVLSGVAIHKRLPWPVVVVAYGLMGCGVVSTVTVSVTYAIDSHKAYTGEFMLIGTVIKNCLSFGFAYISNEWFQAQGFQTPFLILAGVALFLLLVPSVIMYIWGKNMREWVERKNYLPSGEGILSEE